MSKETFCELFAVLQEAVIEAIKNPTRQSVRFVIRASSLIDVLRCYMLETSD